MRKAIFTLGLLTVSISTVVNAENLGIIDIKSKKLTDVSGEEVKSADLADALNKKIPSVSLVRRSGIANDIILRGQKKDNINILIDNAKVYGACPNRMDPPTSHVLVNNIESIEIIEGPYDVENFGTLSGSVKINTKEPAERFQGEASINVGSWNYRKAAATINGGNEVIKYLFSISRETSDQYEDGDGNTFSEQLINFAPTGMGAMALYKPEYEDIKAYEKSTFLGKIYADIADDQQLRFSYIANRSDDVLYPSSGMDALYDDSDIFNLEYTLKNLGDYSDELDFQLYNSQVDHPMSTFYRMSSGPGSANEIISQLSTEVTGFKVTNNVDIKQSLNMTYGFDTSNRNWDGVYIGEGTNAGITGTRSIDDVDTENRAMFAELEFQSGNTQIKVGARIDDTSIDTQDATLNDNDYSSISGHVLAKHQLDNQSTYFVGFGRASRVPDARELYFRNRSGDLIGTPTLNDTRNYEFDFGVENTYDSFNIKTKLFYSWLKDYIYFNADNGTGMSPAGNAFENIDATIYGLELGGTYFVSDSVFIDFGLAYLKGEKDEALAGQTDTDLAEIPPLKANLAVNYEYGYNNMASIEVVAADAWDSYDMDNGEQAIAGYGVTNLKLTHNVTNDIELTAGIDNIFNKTYAISNTYNDLTLLSAGGVVMLLNEPGRYYYLNAAYQF